MRVQANLLVPSAACTFFITNDITRICDLENEGQGHGVQHVQWFHSMAIAICVKVLHEHFMLPLTIFKTFSFQNT